MARTTDEIIETMDAEQAAQPTLVSELTTPSQTGIYTLWKYITAQIINYVEQLWDAFKIQLEASIATAPVGSESWLQSKVFEFQYSATVPQLLEVVDFAPAYNPVDETLRIITRCAVKTAPNNTVLVKVAKSDPPVALSAPELAALQSYLTDGGDGSYVGRGRGLGFAGINIKAISLSADRLFINGTIYYNGQFASVIAANVIAAINTYMANLPFNGSVSLLDITDAIQSVEGVNDIFLNNVAIRASATAFASKSYLIQSNTTSLTTYPTYAGYIIEEDTVGEDFLTKLTFTPS
jgi:hypothetical protein